jgi:hypothetical protein
MPVRLPTLATILADSLYPLDLFSHPGRTDANGGHYNRKTGEYHYHNSGARAAVHTPKTNGPPRQARTFYAHPCRINLRYARPRGRFWHSVTRRGRKT